jgi:tellurite resistance protein
MSNETSGRDSVPDSRSFAREMETFDDEKLQALIEVMVLAASADGEFQAEERTRLERAVGALAPERLGKDALPALFGTLEERAAKEGRLARLAAAKKTLGDASACKMALELALQVMMADGVIRTSERELILETAEALDIDRDVAADMVKAASRP